MEGQKMEGQKPLEGMEGGLKEGGMTKESTSPA
jgi:hypothetical protein